MCTILWKFRRLFWQVKCTIWQERGSLLSLLYTKIFLQQLPFMLMNDDKQVGSHRLIWYCKSPAARTRSVSTQQTRRISTYRKTEKTTAMKKLIVKIREILRNRRARKIWTRTVSSIACLIVFITTYALVLPAITMESEATCGIEAHQHSETCRVTIHG